MKMLYQIRQNGTSFKLQDSILSKVKELISFIGTFRLSNALKGNYTL